MNGSDVDEVYLSAKARFSRWQQDFILQWMAPTMAMQAMAWWVMMPEDKKAVIRMIAPDAAATFDAKVREVE